MRRYSVTEYLRTLESDSDYKDMLISYALEGNSNALLLLNPYLRPSEVAAYKVAYRMNQKLQKQNREAMPMSRQTETLEVILGRIPLSEEEIKMLHTMPLQLIAEILRTASCVFQQERQEGIEKLVQHLQSFEY